MGKKSVRHSGNKDAGNTKKDKSGRHSGDKNEPKKDKDLSIQQQLAQKNRIHFKFVGQSEVGQNDWVQFEGQACPVDQLKVSKQIELIFLTTWSSTVILLRSICIAK